MRVGSVILALGFVPFCALSAVAQGNPDRNAYFGETHVHTSWSFDAYIFGNHMTGPADAYKYALGQTIKHPLGYDVKITTPLDWMGVTDHAEYMGTVKLSNEAGSALSKLPVAQKLIVREPADIEKIYLWLATTLLEGKPIEELVTPEVVGTIWNDNVAIAQKYNDPGKFTTFCSYEWSSAPENRNLHRNIFFKDCDHVPAAPFSSLDSTSPEDLFDWMDGQRKAGNDLLAISHNANLSDGYMFPTEVDGKGRPIDAAWAESRNRNERLTELKQLKGASETHPVLSPEDDFANYEILSYLLGGAARAPVIPGSYVRQALKDGLTMDSARGFNPYKMGFVAASDSHDTASSYREDNYFGGHGALDGTIEARMSGQVAAGLDLRLLGTAGLAGVWAEENTRASLFAAMQRKETFGTSGPRITVRFFAGPDFTSDIFTAKDWVKDAYAGGVPMGSDMPALPTGKAPSFVVWAVKDPTSGNLDRVQIVKGWAKQGQSFEKIFDVVWAGDRAPDPVTGKVPAIGSTVDIPNATYTNTIGAVELKGVWTDPEFDPSLDAFYYVRVLEIPTPRWTTIQAHQLGIPPPDVVAATIQERAWASPIWYTPSKDLRAAAKAGLTVAGLKQQGAVALDDTQLKDMIVGKSTWVRNDVTGDVFQIVWSDAGRRLITNVNGKVPPPSEVGDALHGGQDGADTAYAVKDGAVITTLGNAPYEARIYKLKDKYFAARSNEFGFANYEVVPAPLDLDPTQQPQKSPF